jgi:hypothetical protein
MSTSARLRARDSATWVTSPLVADSRAWAWAAVLLLSVAAAAAVLLWPLSGLGVSGNALKPHYSREFVFGVSTYEPLPKNPSARDLRRAGIVLPKDRVADRRRQAAEVLAAGLIVTLSGLLVEAGRRKG